MIKLVKYLVLLLVIIIGPAACLNLSVRRKYLTPIELEGAKKLGLDSRKLGILKQKPLYEFTPADVDLYLKFLQAVEPDKRRRLAHLARKGLGQTYKIYLLGEFPFELYDPDPLYTLGRSDCVVFCEHIYAMTLAWDWKSFFALLQRIRYKDGEISMVTRNHFTIADWDRNNSWLISDITEEIGGELVKPMTEKTNRKKFFARYGIKWEGEEVEAKTTYIPAEAVPGVIAKLQDGDFVNVIRGFEEPAWCGHTGLIVIGDKGEVNLLHSTPPRVKEQPLLEYMEKSLKANPEKKKKGKAQFFGFKFFRFREDALEELKRRDGEEAPKVSGPKGILKMMPRFYPEKEELKG